MEKSVVTARPVDDVWAVVSHLDNVKRWLSGVASCLTGLSPV
jgi:carbon monoxide dehydrogenase subunit G